MANKWFTKLTKDVGAAAVDMPKPSDHLIKLPSPSLNWAVDNGGITRGKAVCLFGPESGGKSLLMQLILKQLMLDFPESFCVLFDAEFSFNPVWFQTLTGFSDHDMARLIVRQTNNPIEIFDYTINDINEMVQDGCPIVGLAIDSVKAIQ